MLLEVPKKVRAETRTIGRTIIPSCHNPHPTHAQIILAQCIENNHSLTNKPHGHCFSQSCEEDLDIVEQQIMDKITNFQ